MRGAIEALGGVPPAMDFVLWLQERPAAKWGDCWGGRGMPRPYEGFERQQFSIWLGNGRSPGFDL